MNKIKKILIPTDFSETAESALTYALNFGKTNTDIEIILLHVSEFAAPGNVKEKLEGKLQPIKDEISAIRGVSCDYILAHGDLTKAILEAKEGNDIDLIIMGTKGCDGDGKYRASNTSKLVLEADCPVLVTPKEIQSFSIKNIALALGQNDIDDSFALGILHDIARSFDADIHILTISKDGNEIVADDQNESILEYYLETLDYRHVFPKNTDIEKGIEQYIEDKNIDMLVILPRNHAKKGKPSEGRLTELLTLHTKVPLLTID